MRRSVQTDDTGNKKVKKPFILSSRDDEIIHAVYTYRYVTAEQVTRLFYSKGSLKYVRDNLKELSDNKYLYRFHMPTTTPGTTPYVYTLASKGIKYLKSLDMEISLSFRPSEADQVSYQHINHTLALNDFLIAAALLTRLEPAITIHDLRHDWQLKHTPLTVKVKEETISVVPDAFVDFHYKIRGGIFSTPIWLELDRGTIGIKQFKRKIRALLAAIASPAYEQLFNTKAVTIAFATTVQEHRLQNMMSWVMQELKDLERTHDAALFLFTVLPQGELEPRKIFLDKVWYMPSSEQPLALIELI